MRRIVQIGAAICASMASGGCMSLGPLGPEPHKTGYSYEAAWASQTFPVATEPALGAALEGMADLQMRSIHQSKYEKTAILLDGQAHDGRHVRVVIRPVGEASQVSTRVGRFGDEALSKAVLERIGVRLGTVPPTPIPDEPPTSGTRLPFSKLAVPDAIMLREQADAGYRDSTSPN
jgi:hypothetical protein